MTAECQQLRLALGLSAGVNVLLFFCIAWSMAVTRGLTGKSQTPLSPRSPSRQ